MKKSILLKALLATLLLALLPLCSSAYDFSAEYNGKTIYYDIYSADDQTVEVTYKSLLSNGSAYTGEVDIPATVKDENDEEGTIYTVVRIGRCAFMSCADLTSIVLPETITSIGGAAFSWCTGLTSIDIPGSVTSFGDGAFNYCSGLTSITIPSSVTSIGSLALYECTSLTKIQVAEDNEYYCSKDGVLYSKDMRELIQYPVGSTQTSFEIPSTVTNIDYGAFENCSSLTSIEIPSSVSNIESLAFYNCTGLTSIVIPSGVSSIGDKAFNGCENLSSVEMQGDFTSVGSDIFANCDSIKNLIIGEDVTTLPDGLFSDTLQIASLTFNAKNCTIFDVSFIKNDSILTSITIGENVKSIPEELYNALNTETTTITSIYYYANLSESLFDESFFTNNEITECTFGDNVDPLPYWIKYLPFITSYTYNDNCAELLDTDFFDNENITELTIGEDVETIPEELSQLTSVTTIYYNAVNAEIDITDEVLKAIFANYKNLTKFIIGETVKTLADFLLKDCASIETLELPSTLEGLGKGSFEGCTGLKEIKGFGDTKITALPDSIFHGCTALEKIELPSGIISIGKGAFEGCISIKEIEGFSTLNIPAIPDNTFHGCVALEKIEIPSSATSIGDYAFAGNDKPMTLQYIYFGDDSQLQSIGNHAFYYCENITTLEITNYI
ncbi:MAG: leucine-rich repeat domain-containing protein, partial [Prevotella sp.]|nr:leucine-rich repeat domain-containing protein [Prevotella sp.]